MDGPWADFQAPATGPWEDFKPQQQSPSFGQRALDIAKQAGAGLAEGAAAIPGTIPSLIGLAGKGISNITGLPQPEPIINAPPTPDQQLSAALPQPQTGAGEAARTIGNFIPSALGLSGGLGRNLAAAGAAGLGAFGAGQAAPDEQSKPYFELGGAAIGAPFGLRSAEGIGNAIERRAVPSSKEILDAAGKQYTAIQNANNANPITQNALDIIADQAKQTLNQTGPRASVAPGIHNAIEEIRTPGTKSAPDVADLVAARQSIKDFFSNPLPDANKAGAAKILPQLDAAIEQFSPGTMAKLREADANWSAGRTGEALDRRVQRAELRKGGEGSGMNLGNRLIQNASSMVLSNKESRGLRPDEVSALSNLGQGPAQWTGRLLSNMLGGGGGAHAAILGLGGAIGGYESGHPELAALPALGMGLRGMVNRSVANQAENIGAMIRARSPYAQKLGAVPPTPRLPAALPSLYAKPALGGILAGQQQQ